MTARQAINTGSPSANYVAETGLRAAILPGLYLIEQGAISASAAVSIGAITAAITGTAPDNARLAATLAPITLAATGTAPDNARLAETIAPISLSAQAQVLVKATLAETIAAPSAAITGTVTGAAPPPPAPADILAGGWVPPRRKRRQRQARLDQFLPPITCRAEAAAYWPAPAPAAARLAPIRGRAAPAIGEFFCASRAALAIASGLAADMPAFGLAARACAPARARMAGAIASPRLLARGRPDGLADDEALALLLSA